jgi:hypothetical protein
MQVYPDFVTDRMENPSKLLPGEKKEQKPPQINIYSELGKPKQGKLVESELLLDDDAA